MKIALALEYPLMQQGGTEGIVRELLHGLSSNYEIVLVSEDLSLAGLPQEYARLISQHFSWDRRSPVAGRALAERLRESGVLLAHFHFGGTYGWRSNRFWQSPVYHLARLGVPCVSTNHRAVEWLDCGCHPARSQFTQFFFQLFALASRSIIYRQLKWEACVSRNNWKRIQRQFPAFKRKVVPVYHSVLRESEKPDPVAREKVIINVGHIAQVKGQHILAEAFAQIAPIFPDWNLQLVGPVAEEDIARKIREICQRFHLEQRIRLLGARTDIPMLLQRATIYVQPSLEEGLGLAVQEALFWGCAAVGSRVGGIPEVLDEEKTGLLVRAGNVQELAAAIRKLIENKSLRDAFSSKGRDSILAKGMTSEKMAATYRNLYGKLSAKNL